MAARATPTFPQNSQEWIMSILENALELFVHNPKIRDHIKRLAPRLLFYDVFPCSEAVGDFSPPIMEIRRFIYHTDSSIWPDKVDREMCKAFVLLDGEDSVNQQIVSILQHRPRLELRYEAERIRDFLEDRLKNAGFSIISDEPTDWSVENLSYALVRDDMRKVNEFLTACGNLNINLTIDNIENCYEGYEKDTNRYNETGFLKPNHVHALGGVLTFLEWLATDEAGPKFNDRFQVHIKSKTGASIQVLPHEKINQIRVPDLHRKRTGYVLPASLRLSNLQQVLFDKKRHVARSTWFLNTAHRIAQMCYENESHAELKAIKEFCPDCFDRDDESTGYRLVVGPALNVWYF